MTYKRKKLTSEVMSISQYVRRQIESRGERIWRLSDFENLPSTGVAQALSRLHRKGIIQRVGKGLYYHPIETMFGQSKLNTSNLRSLPIHKGIFPSDASAANLLGFSTQNPAKIEIATNGLSLPRLIVGKDTIIHTRRPESWRTLSNKDAAILDFLRKHGLTSELSPNETVCRLLEHFYEPGRFERLLQVAISEPPRVRAMLGAIGQELGYSEIQLFALKKSLNSLSRFDFGKLVTLKYARQWQAKEPKNRETF